MICYEISQPVSCGLFGCKGCKFEKKLDFLAQIWLNSSIEVYNRLLISRSKRKFIA